MEKRLTADLNVVANSNLEIQLLDGDLNIIQKLDDEPNDVGGLTSAELKAKFDEGGNIIKKYINKTLIPAVLTDDATEESRKQAEAARVAAEQGRVTAEEGRVSAETARAAAEQARSEAEASRVSAENARAEAETARADETAGIVARATAQANAAAGSASQAAGSEQSAKDAADTATGAAISASQSAAAASGSASQSSAAAAAAAGSAAGAETASKTAQSWAVGGTGTREGENTNNAKYWAEQAEAVVGGDFATRTEAQRYVADHNQSATAHSDIREALEGKAAATHASQHGKDGADPITPDAIGAIASTAKGTAGGVASLDADGKVPASQLPETDTYTKDEILKGSTAALLGLGTDAVPDDAFKKIWDKTAVSTRQVHVDFADMLLSGVTGIPTAALSSSSVTPNSASAISYNVSNFLKPNDLITIITTPIMQFYKLANEEQWQSVDFTKLPDSTSESNVLFDYDGEYFYCILGRNSSQQSGYAAGLDLKKTKDFKTFETIASYYTDMHRTAMNSIYYQINGQLYLTFSLEPSSGGASSSVYCAVSRAALSFSPLKTSFGFGCGLFGTYDYSLVSNSISSNTVTLKKRNVLTDETTTVQVPVASTQKYVLGTHLVPVLIENALYLFVSNSANLPETFNLGSNYVSCLVSHDLGNTFENCILSGISSPNDVVLRYNPISQKLYARSRSTHELFEFKNGAFEKKNMDQTWWYYDYSAVHALDEATMVYTVELKVGQSSSWRSRYILMAFKVDAAIEMRGAPRFPTVQLLNLSAGSQEVNFDGIAVFFISSSDRVYVAGPRSVSGKFSNENDAYMFTINQMYSWAGFSGNAATVSTMPETN